MEWLEGTLVKLALDWLWDKLTALVANFKKSWNISQAAEAQASDDTQKLQELKPDATKEDTDAALSDSFKHL